jgi:hypothetical protein
MALLKVNHLTGLGRALQKYRGGGPSSVHSLRVQVGDLGQSYSDEANQDEVGEGSQGARMLATRRRSYGFEFWSPTGR